jgi:Ca-activated chloride channel family protein
VAVVAGIAAINWPYGIHAALADGIKTEMETDMEFLSTFHFLRPWWLLLLPFWLLLSFVLWRQGRGSDGWSALCDPALLGYLTGESTQLQRSRLALAGLMVAGVATVVALAGPAWKQLPQPVFQAQSALVIILDLSRSMLVEDLRPSRLIRARQKLQDILTLRHEGQTGLIVFAGSAFDVVPLTTDNKAIVAMLEALEPSLMPVQGSRASSALEQARAMLKRGMVQHGSVVLLTDGVDADAVPAAKKLVQAGHQLSVLGVGTDAGAPIPSHTGDGGFLKDRSGNIVVPRLKATELQALADAGNGIYQSIRVDDLDVKNLPGIVSVRGKIMKKEDLQTDHWREEGPWLVLLLVLPLLSLVFRRGVLI